ncbi:MAG: ABC transporter ATP-binding protein [Deltaproteobacteria bacterium]|nr:ABC transporter ATP-binding protein [Deltaproteobacteria bacterium]
MVFSEKTAVIEVKGLCKYFKSLKAVDELDLEIQKGEFVALLGPNGAGKTTLIEMIEGIQTPDAGEIKIFGMSWKENPIFLHEKIGIALQETRFTDKLTVMETLGLFQSFYHQSERPPDDIIDLVGLKEKKDIYTQHLSGGQKQKLALAIAIINRPEILLLDEPTTGLDPHARQEIWEILLRLKQAGATLILTTHYMEEAEQLCDRILIMNQGKIIAEGSLEDLLNQNNAVEIIEFQSAQLIQREALLKTEGAIELYLEPNQTKGRLKVKNLIRALPSFLDLAQGNMIDLISLQGRKMTLNDLFVSMTGRRLDE